jgi:hypothetical protein
LYCICVDLKEIAGLGVRDGETARQRLRDRGSDALLIRNGVPCNGAVSDCLPLTRVGLLLDGEG